VTETLHVINAILGVGLFLVAVPATWRLVRGAARKLDILWLSLGLAGLNRVLFNISAIEGAALEASYAFAAIVGIIQISVAVREQRR
jgi:hypothetical protein